MNVVVLCVFGPFVQLIDCSCFVVGFSRWLACTLRFGSVCAVLKYC